MTSCPDFSIEAGATVCILWGKLLLSILGKRLVFNFDEYEPSVSKSLVA
jgi:hypothetical protein